MFEPESGYENQYFVNLPSLENIAIFRITMQLRQYEYSVMLRRYRHLKNTPDIFAIDPSVVQESEIKIRKRVKLLPVPECTKEKIYILIAKTFAELRKWFKNMRRDKYFYAVFWPPRNYKTYVFLTRAVWTQLGAINYAETARSIIRCPNLLNTKQKYIMACSYCLVDLILEFAPEVVRKSYLKRIKPCTQFMVYFWTSCLKGKMHRLNNLPKTVQYCRTFCDLSNDVLAFIPDSFDLQLEVSSPRVSAGVRTSARLSNVGNPKHYRTLICYMLTHPVVRRNESAFTYFWRLLPDENRVDFLCIRLDCCENAYLHSLMLDLTKQQQQVIIREYGSVLLSAYLVNQLETKYILDMAYRLRNSMQVVQFGDLIKELGTIIARSQFEEARINSIYIITQIWNFIPQELLLLATEVEWNSFVYCAKQLSLPINIDMVQYLLNGLTTEMALEVLNAPFANYVCGRMLDEQWDSYLYQIIPEEVEWYSIPFPLEKKMTLRFVQIRGVDWTLSES